jgi:hypothetical protein
LANGRKKASGKNGKRKGGGRSGKRSWFLVIVIGILLQTLVAAFVIVILRPFEKDLSPPAEGSRGSGPPIHYEENGQGPTVAILDDSSKQKGPRSSSSARPGARTGAGDLPLVAIVIDDMGYQQKLGDDLLALELDLSFAFLPHGPLSVSQAARAKRLGRDVLLHFPMEAADQKWDPGPGAITLDMNREQLRAILDENLRRVPLALGINNHMGSRFTQNHEAMQDFLELVRERHLFFLDSMTSQSSVGYFLAREMGIKTTRRQVFLDNVRDQELITAQIRELLKIARKEGWAVGIGHPYPQTLAALREARADILGRARVVGVAELVH